MAMQTLKPKSYNFTVTRWLSFDIWDLRAEEVVSGGFTRIYDNIKVPVNVDIVNKFVKWGFCNG